MMQSLCKQKIRTMKTRKSFAGRPMIISSLIFFSLFVFSSCQKDNEAKTGTNSMYTVSGNASGSQVVPPVSGSGAATISGTYNSNTRLITYTTNWSNLTGAPTAAAFYSGATGVNGAIVGNAWALGTGLTATGSFSSTATLTADQAAQLTSGNLYYTLSTAAHATGEVRGQITVTPQ